MQFFSDVTRNGSKDHTEKFLYFLKTWVLFLRLFSREFDDDDDNNIDDDEWNLVEQQKPLSLISSRDHCQRFAAPQISTRCGQDLDLRRILSIYIFE